MIRKLAALVPLCCWLAGFLAVVAAAAPGTAQAPEVQAAMAQTEKPAPEKVRTEVLHPPPQTVKEWWAIRVFLAWLWFSIAVLLFLLRQMIRETDRVHRLGFTNPHPPPPE